MSKDLSTYIYNDQNIRVVSVEGEPWFVGKDVAKVLGYKDTVNALKSHVDEEDKGGVANHHPLRRAGNDHHQRVWPLLSDPVQ